MSLCTLWRLLLLLRLAVTPVTIDCVGGMAGGSPRTLEEVGRARKGMEIARSLRVSSSVAFQCRHQRRLQLTEATSAGQRVIEGRRWRWRFRWWLVLSTGRKEGENERWSVGDGRWFNGGRHMCWLRQWLLIARSCCFRWPLSESEMGKRIGKFACFPYSFS